VLWVFYYLWESPERARVRLAEENGGVQAAAITDVPPPLPPGPPQEAARLPPLTASTLLEAYKANEIKADMLYKGKRFHLTGTITRIRSDVADEPQVELEREFMGVTAKGLSKEFAASLNKGDAFGVDCIVNGSIAGMPIVDCS